MARKSPQRKAQASRLSVDDWVSAALELLAEGGVGAVKIDRLCVRLGVTKGSFYWHFDDFESFLAAVAERWGDDRDAIRDEFAGLADLPPRERITAMIEALFDPSQWPLDRAVREWARTDERVRERVAKSDRWIRLQVRKALLELGFPKNEADLRADALFYAGVGFIHAAREVPANGAKGRARLVEILTS
jgi:AcrR family transcriptional regulator